MYAIIVNPPMIQYIASIVTTLRLDDEEELALLKSKFNM